MEVFPSIPKMIWYSRIWIHCEEMKYTCLPQRRRKDSRWWQQKTIRKPILVRCIGQNIEILVEEGD